MPKRLGILLILATFGQTAGGVTAEFVAVPAQISTREKESILYVRSKGGALTNLKFAHESEMLDNYLVT